MVSDIDKISWSSEIEKFPKCLHKSHGFRLSLLQLTRTHIWRQNVSRRPPPPVVTNHHTTIPRIYLQGSIPSKLFHKFLRKGLRLPINFMTRFSASFSKSTRLLARSLLLTPRNSFGELKVVLFTFDAWHVCSFWNTSPFAYAHMQHLLTNKDDVNYFSPRSIFKKHAKGLLLSFIKPSKQRLNSRGLCSTFRNRTHANRRMEISTSTNQRLKWNPNKDRKRNSTRTKTGIQTNVMRKQQLHT